MQAAMDGHEIIVELLIAYVSMSSLPLVCHPYPLCLYHCMSVILVLFLSPWIIYMVTQMIICN